MVEVIVSVGLLILISGAMFALLTSVFDSQATMDQRIRRANSLSAWDGFFTELLHSLPRESIILAQEESGVELRIRFINATFSLGPYAEFRADSSFLLEVIKSPSSKNTWVIQIIPYPSLDRTGRLAGDLPPITLVDDIREIRIEFYDAFAKTWTTEWTRNEQKPHAIRVRLQLSTGENSDVIAWIPHA